GADYTSAPHVRLTARFIQSRVPGDRTIAADTLSVPSSGLSSPPPVGSASYAASRPPHRARRDRMPGRPQRQWHPPSDRTQGSRFRLQSPSGGVPSRPPRPELPHAPPGREGTTSASRSLRSPLPRDLPATSRRQKRSAPVRSDRAGSQRARP